MSSSSVVRCPACGRDNRVPAAAGGVPRCGNCHNALSWTAEAGDDDFAQVVEASSVPVLVDFWAEWCAPCRVVTPVLEGLATELAGTVKLVKVNVDRAPRTAERYGIQAVPTLMIMNRGRIVAQRAGAAPGPELRHWVDEALVTA
ncbi:thiol reductase thioredoxin [Sphaerisporangium krabiense]|uniref:Thioredoxin n=1 Tax=Sphaerisporangium krabiense TaxID=763782 RepID=A0A7W8Z182_9ACTN|nr:thioredoxin [Sphaerisporangium krabiense]MBB5625288.1 thioredoxin 2 [Sphaerisporangium krabiense]GII64197.1 thiol reductase thioredoxin [Sphaerisporangium krabiense]